MAVDEAASVVESPRERDLSFRASSPGGLGVETAGDFELRKRNMMKVDGKNQLAYRIDRGTGVAAAWHHKPRWGLLPSSRYPASMSPEHGSGHVAYMLAGSRYMRVSHIPPVSVRVQGKISVEVRLTLGLELGFQGSFRDSVAVSVCPAPTHTRQRPYAAPKTRKLPVDFHLLTTKKQRSACPANHV